MSSKRLYWENPYQRCFTAQVVRRVERDGRIALVLDATCFYPDSGGQPHDTGEINGVRVLEVLEQEDEILHVVEQDVALPFVTGAIDWGRRFDHMQQHCGQHILSAAFYRLLGAQTVSFHLGEEISTIDIDRPSLEVEAVNEVEDLANQVVMENRPVEACEYAPSALEGLSLRKPTQRTGPVRVVSIQGFDRSACGGTHPRATGEVGIIHVVRWEPHRGHTRVSFLCGRRALRDYRTKSRLCQLLASQQSVAIGELPEAIARLQAAEDAARRQIRQLQTRLLDLQAAALSAEAQVVGRWRVVRRFLKEAESGEMRQLAQKITQAPGFVVVLGVANPAPQICLACSEDVPLDMAALFRQLAAPHGGRGGGARRMAQGGGFTQEALWRMLEAADSIAHVLHESAEKGGL